MSYIATFFVLGHDPAACQDAHLRERFLEEAPQAWIEYREFVSHLQGSLRMQVVNRNKNAAPLRKNVVIDKNNPVLRVYYNEFKQADGCFMERYRMQPASARTEMPEEVAVYNPTYVFEARRSASDAPWALLDLSQRTGDSLPENVTTVVEAADAQLGVGFSICNVPLPDILKSASFKLKGVSSVERGAEELVRIEYEYEHPKLPDGGIDGHHPARGGWVLLDPRQHWIVREFDVAATMRGGRSRGRITGDYDYVDDPRGFPIVKHYVKHVMMSSTGDPPWVGDIEEIHDYGLRYDDDISPEEFTLGAFGLPEPEFARRRWHLVLAGVAGVALILCAALLRMKKKPGADAGTG